jgi:prepilin-type N-terminal cleavage/methylation domain-containing protein
LGRFGALAIVTSLGARLLPAACLGWGHTDAQGEVLMGTCHTRTRGSPAFLGRRPLCGFTLLELLIAIAIVVILMGILLGTVATSRDRAKESVCISNLHQLYLALSMYASDNGGRRPLLLSELVPTYTPRELLLCPADSYGGYATTYALAEAPYMDGRTPWPVDPAAPTSYLYVRSHFPDSYWPRLAARADTACVVCWLHGRAVHTEGGDAMKSPPWYAGRAIRLHFDGSVTADSIRAVGNIGTRGEFGVTWTTLFDPTLRPGEAP